MARLTWGGCYNYVAVKSLPARYFAGRVTHHVWRDTPVIDERFHELYELMKWGPRQRGQHTAPILFVESREAKERLRPVLLPANVDQTMAAPVTTIHRL
jgi:3-hydroxypropanoate dehydrogenase